MRARKKSKGANRRGEEPQSQKNVLEYTAVRGAYLRLIRPCFRLIFWTESHYMIWAEDSGRFHRVPCRPVQA